MNRRGFTLIELMVTVTIIGILANIAIPKFGEAKRKADAAKISSDFNAIRHAVYDYNAESDIFPRSRGYGVVPPELVGSLPEGFEFQYKDTSYRWRRWATAAGLPRRRATPELFGVQVRSSDRRLVEALRRVYQGVTFGNARTIALVIE
jgi:prepilin-type N-terminal cleavage/methylation domain-containing protein